VRPSRDQPLSWPRIAAGVEDSSRGCRQSAFTSYRSNTPGSVAALPLTAASRPRRWFTSTDSCGVSMAAVLSVAVFRGFRGSAMSSTTTPMPSPETSWKTESFGNSRVES
jgi:hypothetical protein